MVATLILAAAAAAAPIPKGAGPAGPAPRLVELVPGPDGKVRVTVTRTEKRPETRVVPVAGPNGQVVHEQQTREVTVPVAVSVELAEVKGLTVTTADGKEADKALVLKRLSGGGVVVVSADGKKVAPRFLRVLKDDTLVLVSPELTGLGGPPVGFVGPPVVGTAVKGDVGPPLTPPAKDPPEKPRKD